MSATLPLQWIILAFVIVGIVSFSGYLVAQYGRRRLPVKDECSFNQERAAAYKIPENYGLLKPDEKRRVTVQNLYLNHGKDLDSIAELLEVDRGDVQDILCHCGLLRTSPSNDPEEVKSV